MTASIATIPSAAITTAADNAVSRYRLKADVYVNARMPSIAGETRAYRISQSVRRCSGATMVSRIPNSVYSTTPSTIAPLTWVSVILK
jgi:hypothetical protein